MQKNNSIENQSVSKIIRKNTKINLQNTKNACRFTNVIKNKNNGSIRKTKSIKSIATN
jgi:predicted ATPase